MIFPNPQIHFRYPFNLDGLFASLRSLRRPHDSFTCLSILGFGYRQLLTNCSMRCSALWFVTWFVYL